jgi:hypothetical protein
MQETITAAKGAQDGRPFGNVNVFYLGDFFQFMPVCDNPLFDEPEKGMSHWKQVSNCIVLDQPMRQRPEEVEFLAALTQVRSRTAARRLTTSSIHASSAPPPC